MALPLRGRDGELAAVAKLLREADAGRLRVAVVEGEPGIGKSRLLHEALRLAEARGFGWSIGRGLELERNRPFGAIGAALATWSDPDGLAAAGGNLLLDQLRSDPGSEDSGLHYRLVDGVVGVIERLALQGPIALALEDLHWTDASTLRVLGAAARRLQPHGALLIATVRPVPRSAQLDALLDDLIRHGALHLPLGRLGEEAVRDIAVDVLGVQPGPQLLRLMTGAAGNPLFLTELLAVLREERSLAQRVGTVEVNAASIPPSLRLTILRRLSFLPEPVVELLRLAAVLGESFEADELAALSGRDAVELVSLLEAPRRAGILEADGERLRFRHDLIREAVYEDLPESLRNSLHRQAGHALASAGLPASRVAHHLTVGASVGDREAVAWLRRAATEAGPRDPATAIGQLRQAIGLLPSDDPERAALAAELTSLLAYAGDAREAEEVARSTLAAAHDPALDGDLSASLIQALFAQGRWSDLVAAATDALDSPALPMRDRARLLAERALGRVWTANPDEALADAEEAVRLGRQVGDPVAVCFGLGHLSVLADRRGDFSRGVELAQEALTVGEETREAQRRHPHVALGMALVAADRLIDSIEILRAGQRLGEQAGTAWDLPLYHAMLAVPMLFLGEWDGAVAEAQAGLSLTEEVGSSVGSVTALSTLAIISVARGDFREAEATLTAAEAIVDAGGPQWGTLWMLTARARLLAATGDTRGALERLRPTWDAVTRDDAVESTLRLGPDVVRLALRAGDADLASRATEQVERIAGQAPVPYGIAAAQLCRGLVDDDPAGLVHAVETYRPTARAPETALALRDAAGALARDGDSRMSRAFFEEAVVIFDRLGARHETSATLAAMRARGLRRGVRAPRRRPATGWDALTDAERAVVRLATEGLTNAQIGERLYISPRTVQTHMAHIFNKLGLASRVELAAAAARRGLTDPVGGDRHLETD